MHTFVVGKRTLAMVAVVTVLAACREDKRTAAVDSGISRDSLLTVIGKQAPGIDSLPNVYTRDRYLIDGKTYEILFFSPTGKHLFVGVVKDTIPWKELTPIAMIENRVVGKGWDYVDSLYSAHKIPLKKRS